MIIKHKNSMFTNVQNTLTKINLKWGLLTPKSKMRIMKRVKFLKFLNRLKPESMNKSMKKSVLPLPNIEISIVDN